MRFNVKPTIKYLISLFIFSLVYSVAKLSAHNDKTCRNFLIIKTKSPEINSGAYYWLNND